MPPALHVELAAEPGAAGRSRRATDRWLASLCGVETSCGVVADLLLAINEAVSNSIEHAYRGTGAGTVTLRADTVGRDDPERTGSCAEVRVRVEVSDRGHWRTPPQDPGFRGRGLTMMRACADDVVVRCGAAGTTVTFHTTLGRCRSR